MMVLITCMTVGHCKVSSLSDYGVDVCKSRTTEETQMLVHDMIAACVASAPLSMSTYQVGSLH